MVFLELSIFCISQNLFLTPGSLIPDMIHKWLIWVGQLRVVEIFCASQNVQQHPGLYETPDVPRPVVTLSNVSRRPHVSPVEQNHPQLKTIALFLFRMQRIHYFYHVLLCDEKLGTFLQSLSSLQISKEKENTKLWKTGMPKANSHYAIWVYVWAQNFYKYISDSNVPKYLPNDMQFQSKHFIFLLNEHSVYRNGKLMYFSAARNNLHGIQRPLLITFQVHDVYIIQTKNARLMDRRIFLDLFPCLAL